MNHEQQRQLHREKLLLRYTIALQEGDLDTIAEILQEAQHDPGLEQMIFEINDLEAAEIEETAHQQDAALVRDLLQTHLSSTLPEKRAEPPPLTVGNVFARIHADAAALRVRVERDALTATQKHQEVDAPLPTDLSARGISRLLEELGIQASRRFQELFRDTALFLRMGRNQGMARLAATRRQQESRRQSRPPQSRGTQTPHSPSMAPDEKPPADDSAANMTADEETP